MSRKIKYTILSVVLTAVIAMFAMSVQTARGYPGKQQDCSNCHGTPGSYPNPVTASPSATTAAPGASYDVSITVSPPVNGASGTGYWIAGSDASGVTGAGTGVYGGGPGLGASGNWTATMTAPSTPGTYYYKVFGQSGPIGSGGFPGFALYSITVANSATATATGVPPTATGTSVPPTSTMVPPSATSTSVSPTSTAVLPIPTSPSTVKRGEALYKQYCASCHEPSSPSFVHEKVYGEDREEISEALHDVPAMSFLKNVLSIRDVHDVGVYLKTLSFMKEKEKQKDDNGKHEGYERSKHKGKGIDKNKHGDQTEDDD